MNAFFERGVGTGERFRFGFGGWFGGAGEEMGPAAAGHAGDERLGLAAGEVIEDGFDFFHVGELMHALGAGAEFADGLGSAKHQDAQQGGFAATEIEGFAQAMAVFFDPMARAAEAGGEVLGAEHFEGLLDGRVVVLDDGIAARFLIAGVYQGVERQGIVFGSGEVLFEQRAEYANFDGVKWFHDGLVVLLGQNSISRITLF